MPDPTPGTRAAGSGRPSPDPDGLVAQAAAALCQVRVPGEESLPAAVRALGPVAVWEQLCADPGRWPHRRGAAAEPDLGRRVLDQAGDGFLVLPGGARWPRTSSTGAGPFAVWLRGGCPDAVLARPRVAVLGSPLASGYGLTAAADLAVGLCAAGVAVVSASAGSGVDASVLSAVLECGGQPVLAASHGVGRVPPYPQRDLFESGRAAGVVVSVAAPAAHTSAVNLRDRDRLLGWISDVVVIVESGAGSGVLRAAEVAREAGTPVLAVPGPVTVGGYRGSHQLIRRGDAELATGVEDVLDVLAGLDTDDGVRVLDPDR